MRSATTVVWLTWRQLFARHRVWLAVAVAVFPFLLSFFYRFISEDREGERLIFLTGVNKELILGVLLPITALVFGTTAFGGEVDDGTLIYLLAKPVRRWRVVLLKYVVAVAVSTAVGAAALLLPWLALRNAELPVRFIWAFIVAAAASSAIYCAVFTYLGLVTRRGLVFGLMYIIFFENVMARNFAGAKSFSAREFSLSVAQWASNGTIKWPSETVSIATVWIMGAIILAVSLTVAIRRLGRYEVAERL